MAWVCFLSTHPRPAAAWDSTCTTYADPTQDVSKLKEDPSAQACSEPGPVSAQGRLRSEDGRDEHAAIFRTAIRHAGIPEAVLDTWRMTVFTDNITAGAPSAPMLSTSRPVDFTAAMRAKTRAFAVDELAMLPDFSFSLWDWAMGNETCPLRSYEGASGVDCHTPATHMGMANANHFPPLADATYARLHQMALTRAGQCKATRQKIPTSDRSRFEAFLKECELESLALEAVAQHFLQDIWSSGHMWERWGASDVDRFPVLEARFFTDPNLSELERKRLLAIVVGLSAGMIHGTEPAFSSQPDAMCFPYPEVVFAPTNGPQSLGAGDLHWPDVMAGRNGLTEQRNRLVGCAAASVTEVYAALSAPGNEPTFGPFGPPRELVGLIPPLSPLDCFSQRATNLAMDRGIGVDLPPTGHVRPADFISETVIVPQIAGRGQLSEAGVAAYNADWVRIGFISQLRAAAEPMGTDLAALEATVNGQTEPLTLLTTQKNSAYHTAPLLLASYQDPQLPWPGTTDSTTPNAAERALALARVFHRAHAEDFCTRVTAADLNTLKRRASTVGIAGPLQEGLCTACTEIVERHLRVGSANQYDTNAEPLCHHLAGNAAPFVYQPYTGGLPPSALARQWCGCERRVGTITDSGWYDLNLSGGNVAVVGQKISITPPGAIPRDGALVGDGRALVTYSEGSVVVVDLKTRSEVDIDGDATNGVTRLKPSTATRGVAVVQARGRKYALIVSSATDELVVYDITEDAQRYTLCKRFDIGGDATKTEDAWAIAVMPDQKKAFVSFRGNAASPGDALAVIDVTAATDCATPGGEVPRRLVGIYGSKAQIGNMAVSPDGSKLALTIRRSATCTVTIRSNRIGGTMEMPVGCDSVFLLDTQTETIVSLGTLGYFRSLPTFYPYAAAWTPSGEKLAYAMFQGPDPWPYYQPIGSAGAVRLGNAILGGQSYNVAVKGNFIGPTLIATEDWIYAGTTSGDITALPTGYDFWNLQKADPDTTVHGGDSWYGGCFSSPANCPGGRCPTICPTTLNLGSPIRAMISY